MFPVDAFGRLQNSDVDFGHLYKIHVFVTEYDPDGDQALQFPLGKWKFNSTNTLFEITRELVFFIFHSLVDLDFGWETRE